jgi:hypothetical protein
MQDCASCCTGLLSSPNSHKCLNNNPCLPSSSRPRSRCLCKWAAGLAASQPVASWEWAQWRGLPWHPQVMLMPPQDFKEYAAEFEVDAAPAQPSSGASAGAGSGGGSGGCENDAGSEGGAAPMGEHGALPRYER